jgi:hypothetical protein
MEVREDRSRGCAVHGIRHSAYLAHLGQSGEVSFVGSVSKWVSQNKQRIHLSGYHQRSQLEVPAFHAAFQDSHG